MTDANIHSFQSFLEEFCRYHQGELTEDSPLPLRFLTSSLTVKEVEAEVIDWVFQYLTAKCPRLLATHIAREVADYILTLDLWPFVEDSEDEARPTSASGGATTNQPEHSEQNIPVSDDTVLLISALAPVVFTKVHSVCQAWDHGVLSERFADVSTSSPVHQVSAHAIKNTRRKMEDKHVIHQHLSKLYNLTTKSDLVYVGVFDGHGGQHGSNYAACHFHDNLVRSPKLISDVPSALKDTFLLTDRDFCAKAERESLGSGTTGVCACIINSTLHVGWLGDSEALLVRDGRPVKLVTPHKPERADEQKRIEALGGFVENTSFVYRVNGLISVARAIGDRNLKPFLCADADVVSVDLDGMEDYVVLGCDGLWDVVSHSDIVERVYQHVEEADGDKSGVAQMLVRVAKEQGSEDNITVVVVFLREKTSPPAAAGDSELCVASDIDQVQSEKNDGGSEKQEDQNESIDSNGTRGNVAISDNSKSSNASDSKSSFEPGKKQAGSGTLHSIEILEVGMSPGSSKDTNLVRMRDQGPTDLQHQVISSLKQISAHISTESTCSESREKSSTPSLKSSSRMRSVHSDTHSGGSGDLMMMAAAAKCVNNRRGRRGRNGRRRNNHRDTRRASKDSAGIAHRTGSTPSRLRSSSESKVSVEVRPPCDSKSCRSGGDGMFRTLMGCNPNMIYRSRSHSRWTVAVEMELETASAMFEDVLPESNVSKKYKVQKK